MTFSIYQASIPAHTRILENLSTILTKAATSGADTTALAEARLAPDMLPLTRQIQIATDVVKGSAARLAAIDVPSYEDTETTFAELQDRIAKTVSFLNTITPAQLAGAEDRTINLKVGGNELSFTGADYLVHFVQPNFYFHVTTAYAILRHNGIEIGKMDYLGALPQQQQAA